MQNDLEFAATEALSNQYVRLEPLGHQHLDDLIAAVYEGNLWRTWYARVPAPESMAAEIDRRLDLQRQGTMAPWAVINPQTNKAVGMTTFMNISAPNRGLEIGSTWLGRSAQGTAMNPAAKLLLLQRAFEDLDCLRVEFRTHWFNHQSRAAIAKLGAKQEAVLRNHQVLPNGTVRDTVIFSLINSEWPAAKVNLEYRLGLRT